MELGQQARQDHEDPQGKLVQEVHLDQLVLWAQQDNKDRGENREQLVKLVKRDAVVKLANKVTIT